VSFIAPSRDCRHAHHRTSRQGTSPASSSSIEHYLSAYLPEYDFGLLAAIGPALRQLFVASRLEAHQATLNPLHVIAGPRGMITCRLETPHSKTPIATKIGDASMSEVYMHTRSLSPIELEVLSLFAKGKTTEEIGTALNMHKGAVQNHLRVVTRKMGASNRVHAAVIAAEMGLIKTFKRSM
jgi:DNA-binding NarL/FixJ family response regulator